MPETDDARYERKFWLKLIERTQKEASGQIDISEDRNRVGQRQAQRWITSCARKRSKRSCIQCQQFLRVGELAGLSENQMYDLAEKEKTKYA